MMDWAALLNAAKAALSTLEGVALSQGEQLVASFEKALPAIQTGAASAQPFLVNAFDIITGRATGMPADQWATQLSLMDAQIAAVDAQVAKDAQDQP